MIATLLRIKCSFTDYAGILNAKAETIHCYWIKGSHDNKGGKNITQFGRIYDGATSAISTCRLRIIHDTNMRVSKVCVENVGVSGLIFRFATFLWRIVVIICGSSFVRDVWQTVWG